MSAPGGADAFEQLKALLLGETTDRLDAAIDRLERIDARVGDPEKLGAATGDILIEALQRAETRRHRELTQALAPLVVSAIRSEIKNSKEMMIEALYPITGRLVTAAVAGAFRDLVETLNARIDALVSTQTWRLRLRALATGRSLAEVALAEADAGRLKRALLLERGSGLVLGIWPPDAAGDGNADLASGMIAAITEFAASVYADSGGELRMLDLGASSVFLRASPRVIIAAEFGGELSRQRESRLDEAFLSIVEQHERDAAACTPETLGGALNDALAEEPAKPKSKKPALVAALIVAALALWAAWGPVERGWRASRVRAAYATALAAHPGLAQFPLRLDIEHDARRVVLRGLAANASEPQAIVDTLAPVAAPYEVARDISIVALASQTEEMAAGETRAAQTLRDALNQLDALRADLAATRAALDAQAASPQAKLRKFVESFAVFFSDRDNLVDAPATLARLAELADLVKASGVGLRVVGYADEAGAVLNNRALSRKRAEKVIDLLVERGAPRERLALTPRGALNPIADAGLDAARSRRVVFELPYAGEFDLK